MYARKLASSTISEKDQFSGWTSCLLETSLAMYEQYGNLALCGRVLVG